MVKYATVKQKLLSYKSKLNKILLALFVIGLLFYLIWQNVFNKPQEVQITKAKRRSFRETIVLTGKIDARDKAILQFQLPGRLSFVGVKEGDLVKKGKRIASLDQRDVEKNLQKSLNTFLSARWDLDQNKEDYKPAEAPGNLGPKWQRIIDKSQFSLNNTILDVELKDLAIQYSHLYSPINGVVTKVGAPLAGVNITPNMAVYEIVDPNTIFFAINIDQADLSKISTGMIGELILDAFDTQKKSVMIEKIGFTPVEGEVGTVYRAELTMEKSDGLGKYRLGMTGDVEFLLSERKDVLSVEGKYIKSENGNKYVFIQSLNKLIKTPIKIGSNNEGFVEIKEGISEGDALVLPKK